MCSNLSENQSSVRQAPHLHQTYTIYLTNICWMSGICLVNIWCTYGVHMVQYMSGRHMVRVWCICGTCLIDVWRELTDVWLDISQASDNRLEII